MKRPDTKVRGEAAELSRLHLVSGQDGFTLAELLVFLVIMIIFLIGVGGMISAGAKSSAASFNLVRIENAANETMVAITRQIRVANAINANSNAQSITFAGYLDGYTEETVTLTVQEGYLTRNDTPWIADVESMNITYYDERGIQLVTGTPNWNTQVRRVDIGLAFARESMGIRLSREFKGTVTLRNRLDQV
jgi:type II secretory pathway pseudopilin PulG